MSDLTIAKFKTRIALLALVALPVAVALVVAVRRAEQGQRVASGDTPAVAAAHATISATEVVDGSAHEASNRDVQSVDKADGASSVPLPPQSASVPRFLANPGDTSYAATPVRHATDSGRAQPVFIALMAPPSVHMGEPFRVAVTGESENDFGRVALAVRFDSRILRVTGVRQGDLMAKAGATAAFSYAVDAQEGRVSIELNENEGGNPVSGGGTLCSVAFVGIAPGRTPLSIADVVVEDLDNEGVAYSVLPAPSVAIRE